MPLAPRTTLELGGAAEHLVEACDDATLIEALRWARERALPVTLLGGGSNVVIADEGLPGLTVVMRQRGIEWQSRGAVTRVTARAGEPWDALVAACVERDLAGLECLSGIPGLAGATPIQNVGAYGQEVSDVIDSVEVLDRETLEVSALPAERCGFGYRDSFFKRHPERHAVLSVTYALQQGGAPTLRYAELARALEADGGEPSLPRVRSTVLSLRRGKSMLVEPGDPNRRSVGSFFHNPVVDAGVADELVARAVAAGLVARAADVPRYPAAGGRVKLAAGWLVERSGIARGSRRGAVGISSRHALALVHHGGGETRELLALAREVRGAVRARFGIELAVEPSLLGCEL